MATVSQLSGSAHNFNDEDAHADYNEEYDTNNEAILTSAVNMNVNPDTPPPSEGPSPPANVTPRKIQKLILRMGSKPTSDSLPTQAPATSKAGRRNRARKKQEDALTGDEYEGFFAGVGVRSPSTRNKRDKHRSFQQEYSPPTPVEGPSSSTIGEEDELSKIISQGLNGKDNLSDHLFFAHIDDDIHNMVAQLASRDPFPTNLPYLDRGAWTAEDLTHLYISAYESRIWNVCDLVADTWIRAFHDLNNTNPIWRANTSGHLKKNRSSETFRMHQFDPPLEAQVCAFEAKLLNNLYHHTDKSCGARMLWADSMALVGAEWEAELTSRARRNNKWHPDLQFNVMCTALRMVRRLLTLKIEESTEDAWCRRYHMHTVHGKPCYQELAREAAKEAAEEAELGRKRGVSEIDGGDMEGERRRVSFGGMDGMVDEYDSEEDQTVYTMTTY